MRLSLLIWLTICFAGLASAFQQPTNPWATVPRPPHGVSAPYDSKAERQLLDLANQARAEAGLAPLQSDEGVTRAARKHSALMASQKRLSHDLPGEPALPQRLAATSTLQFSAEGENVGLAPSAAKCTGASCILRITGRIYSIPITTWPDLPSSATETRFT